MSNWRKFRRLPPEEKATFAAALALFPAVRVGLRTLGLRRVLAMLDSRPDAKPSRYPSDPNDIRRARHTARLVAVAARYAGGTCLARSIVLLTLLRRRGVSAQLRIGVRKDERGFEAHAWVEAGGAILNDEPAVRERFAAFDRNFALARVNWR